MNAYLDMLFGAEPDDSYAELRWRLRNGRGMGQEFLRVRHQNLGILIVARGHKTDLYVGAAPRTRQEGTRDAVERVHVLWVDLDTPEAIERSETFHPRPSMVVRSGSGQHAYWSLWPPAAPDDVERANRRLAHALNGDMRATDAARILRPPGSFNFKSGEPVPVTVEHADPDAIYTLAEVVGHLPDPPEVKRERRPVTPLQNADDPLKVVPPPIYVEALTGLEAGRDGKARCPFHEDRTPSLHVYEDPERGWYCFGCGLGGGIIDLGPPSGGWSLEARASTRSAEGSWPSCERRWRHEPGSRKAGGREAD